MQLQQVLMNLINNARDSLDNHETPVISIMLRHYIPNEAFLKKHRLTTEKYYAHLSVSDNGKGISSEDLQYIFEPFFTKKKVGTGLGLFMIHGTVASHGGFIEVDSVVDEGASFNIYLPLLDNDTMQEPEPINIDDTHDEVDPKGQHILLVDDEKSLRETNHAVLESIGYTVVDASDGLEAIQIYKQQQDKIQLIIMDVVMPKMGGITASKRILEINASVPILFVTGYDSSQVLGHITQNIKNYSILNKPFNVQKLSKAIKKCLANHPTA
ncbi:MAG: response regulator [Mariprofundaceae bacterium]|nr:response regulator [Mariprofundaceae bacterium]